MNMFEKVGEFTPDSLVASGDFPILKAGIGLKAGQGVLKRGSLIMKCADGDGYIAGSKITITTGEGENATTKDLEMKVFGILADHTDTGTDKTAENIPVVCYQTGVFNRGAVIVTGKDEAGKNVTVDKYEDDMKAISLFLCNVQKYE